MSDFKPWVKYPDLTEDRLSTVANLLRRVRRDAVALHDPGAGDGDWSLGCRIYERNCHALREGAMNYTWLRILPELEQLRFSFSIGTVPFRFYTGRPDDPPSRYSFTTFGEIHHQQLLLGIGAPPIDAILRLAIEPDGARDKAKVTLVEMDEDGDVTANYEIASEAVATNVSTIQAEPINLPAPKLEPLKRNEEQEEQKNQKKKV